MIRILAILFGEGQCPACEGDLHQHEAGYHVCECGVVVDYARGAWRYAGESKLRQLPGLGGMAFRESREPENAPRAA